MAARELPPGDWRLVVYGRSQISGVDRRRAPRAGERARVIESQGNKCLYCEIPIGTAISRRSKTVVLRANWDHFAPYSYIARNPRDNWVLACHVCNGLKTGRMFASVQQVRDVVLPERLAKGYEDPLAVLQRLGSAPADRQWPERLRAPNGSIVHHAREARLGHWETACGLEKATASWRTPGGSTRPCADCAARTGAPDHTEPATTAPRP